MVSNRPIQMCIANRLGVNSCVFWRLCIDQLASAKETRMAELLKENSKLGEAVTKFQQKFHFTGLEASS
jgi:hypothetical protein